MALSVAFMSGSPGATKVSCALESSSSPREFGERVSHNAMARNGSFGSRAAAALAGESPTGSSAATLGSSYGSLRGRDSLASTPGKSMKSSSSMSQMHGHGTPPMSSAVKIVGFDLSDRDGKSGSAQKPPIGMLRAELAGEFGYDAFDGDAYRRALAAVPEIFAEPTVREAFEFAAKTHAGPGLGPHFDQCVEIAIALAKLGMDAKTVAVGLLHDALDVTSATVDDLRVKFPEDLVELVQGVARLHRVSKLHRASARDLEHNERAQLRAMILAMTDARVVIVKLAARLIKMRNLHTAPPAQQASFAEETLAIYAPLANRLGIFTIKNELEDLAFKWTNARAHAELSSRLESRAQRDSIVAALTKLDEALSGHRVEVIDMCGRQKSLYSVYKKMVEKNQALEDIMDVRAIRVIIADGEDDKASEAACRAVLDYVHGLWTPVDGRMKDYITTPKRNGYQSLHTVVRDDSDSTLEVQIRTASMHRTAEFGVAAHWRYKEHERSATSAKVDQQVQWARFMLTWQNELEDQQKIRPARVESLHDCGASLKPCMFPEHSKDCPHHEDSVFCQSCEVEDVDAPMYVITVVDGAVAVRELKSNSTLGDLQLEDSRVPGGVRSTEFYRVSSVRVNKKSVSPEVFAATHLRMGDVVEVSRTRILSPNKSWDETEDVSVFEDLNLEIHALRSDAKDRLRVL
jgi:GTP pyrophosphokinase